MNVYEDYANYISECQELIEEMIKHNSSVSVSYTHLTLPTNSRV